MIYTYIYMLAVISGIYCGCSDIGSSEIGLKINIGHK